MNERSTNEAFSEIVGDMQYTEFNEALGVCQEYAPVTDKAERLHAVVEALLVECGPYDELTDEEKVVLLSLIERYVGYQLLNNDQLGADDEIIASGDAFVLCADHYGDGSNIEMLGSGIRLHGRINKFRSMPVPVFMNSNEFFDTDFTPLVQLSVVIDVAQPALEMVADESVGREAQFHDLCEHDHVLLPLVYTKDGLQIKRRVIEP